MNYDIYHCVLDAAAFRGMGRRGVGGAEHVIVHKIVLMFDYFKASAIVMAA